MRIKHKSFCLGAGILCVSIVSTANAYDYEFTNITDFSGWSGSVNNGQVSLTAKGADDFSQVKTDSTADAFFGQVDISAFNCPSFCMARIHRWIGTYKGNDVRAEIRAQAVGDERKVHYRIRTYEPGTNNLVETLAYGDIGNRNAAWSTNTSIGLAVGIKGNEIVFYGSNQSSLQKLEFLTDFTPYNPPGSYGVAVYSETAADSITATFSDFIDVGLTP